MLLVAFVIGHLFAFSSAGANEGSATEKAEVARYDIDVAVDVALRTVAVRETIDAPASWSSPALWLYADRLREVAPSFDEFEAERIYTYGIDRGGYSDVVVVVAGCAPQRVAAIDVDAPPPALATHGRDVAVTVCTTAARPLRVEVTATLTLPGRLGTLGAAGSTLTLGDPWYPLLLPSSDVAAPPLADHVVRVTTPSTEARVLASASGAASFDDAHPAKLEQRAVTHAPAVILPADVAIASDRYDGVDLTLVTDELAEDIRSPLDGANDPHAESIGQGGARSDVGDAFDLDTAGLLQGTVRDCVSFLRRHGYEAAPDGAAMVRGLSPSLVVVMVPERQRLAVVEPGMLLVSDHAFHMVPLDRVRRLHALPIARRAFGALLAPHVAATSSRQDAAWTADLDGALLLEQRLQDGAGKRETPRDLIKVAGFLPSVDQLIYAPKIAFGPELFGIVDEPDPDRYGAERARNPWPFGRLVLEKLRDRLGSAPFDRASAAHFFGGASWRAAAEQVASKEDDLATFWAQWIGPRRHLAYRITSVRSEPDRWGTRTFVSIERLGDTWIREPVVIEVTDTKNDAVRGAWDEAGASGEISIVTAAPFDHAKLDPDEHLPEDPSLTDSHPRFDDETSHAWRPPVLTGGSNFSYAASEHRVDFSLAFTLRRRFDVDQGIGLSAHHDARGYGGTAQWIRGFGALRDLNNRFGTWSVGAGGDRYPAGFAGGRAASQGSLLAAIGWDTVQQLQDPMGGYGVLATADVRLAKEDSGRWSPNVAVGARTHVFSWEHVRTSTVLVAGANVVIGSALETQLQGLAAKQVLRSYEGDELIGKTRAYVILEQRFHVLAGRYWSLLDGAFVKAVELVPFAAIGAVSSRESAVDFKGGHLGAEVGAGLRLLMDYGGLQPAVLVIDFAFPLIRADPCARAPDGTCAHTRQKFGFWIGFEQTY